MSRAPSTHILEERTEAYHGIGDRTVISYTVTEERIRRQRGREKPSADMIGMRHQRASNWGLGGLIAAAVLLSPVLAFLMALAVDIVIGFLNDGREPALLVVAAGAIGGFLLRKLRMRPPDRGSDWT